MKQSDAIQYIRNAMTLTQKMRSNTQEELVRGDPVAAQVVEDVQKWVYSDEFTLVNSCSKILSAVDAGGELAPMDFYNIMYIIHRFAPEINAITPLFGMKEFPKPDIDVIRGWN